MYISRKEAERLLPKVGDKRREVPTVYLSSGRNEPPTPQPCVVVRVNQAHLWYTVEFENGFRESYKVPRWGGGGQ